MEPAKHKSDRLGLLERLSQIPGRQAAVAEPAAAPGKAWPGAAVSRAGVTPGHSSKPRLVAGSSEVNQPPLRVLIADDQLLVRAGICELVKALPNVVIVGEASDGRAVLRLIETLEPDLVLMDIAMPGMNGLEALVLAKRQFSQVKVIILSEHSNEEFVFRALRSGAAGFVVKDDPVGELYTAIRSVAEGGEHLSPQVTRKIVFGYVESHTPGDEPAKRLTSRQLEVLQRIAEGKSTKEIASQLNLSINTVKTHRLKLMEKLGVHEVSGVVRYAVKVGLIKN